MLLTSYKEMTNKLSLIDVSNKFCFRSNWCSYLFSRFCQNKLQQATIGTSNQGKKLFFLPDFLYGLHPLRGHPWSKYAKFIKKITFPTALYTHVCMRIREWKQLHFWTILWIFREKSWVGLTTNYNRRYDREPVLANLGIQISKNFSPVQTVVVPLGETNVSKLFTSRFISITPPPPHLLPFKICSAAQPGHSTISNYLIWALAIKCTIIKF